MSAFSHRGLEHRWCATSATAGSSGAVRERPLLIEAVESRPDTARGNPGHPTLDAWRRKVERIGTINYPTAARGAAAQASPVVEVGIAADGTLDRVIIRRTSATRDSTRRRWRS